MRFMLATLALLVGVLVATGPPCRVVTRSYAPVYEPVHHDAAVIVQKVAVADFFYSNRDFYRDEADAKRSEALLEAIKALREAKGIQLSSPGSAAPGGSGDDPFGIPPLAGFSSSVSAGSEISQIVASKCIKCHSGTGKSHFLLTDLDRLSRSQRMSVYEEVASGSMPPTGRLPKDQVRAFGEWASR